MFEFNDIEKKIGDGVEKQLKDINSGVLILSGILVAGLVCGLKVIADVVTPHLKSIATVFLNSDSTSC